MILKINPAVVKCMQEDNDMTTYSKDFKQDALKYIDMFYNTRRIHSHCSYIPPNVYEKLYYMQHATESSIAA